MRRSCRLSFRKPAPPTLAICLRSHDLKRGVVMPPSFTLGGWRVTLGAALFEPNSGA